MKEIKVATITKEEIKESNELRKMETKIKTLIAQATSAHFAFWAKLATEHNLPSGNHYIVGNSIYIQDIE